MIVFPLMIWLVGFGSYLLSLGGLRGEAAVLSPQTTTAAQTLKPDQI
jgi:hypothetical protein